MTDPGKLIPVAAPSITEREGALARDAALHAHGPDHYRFNRRLEQMFAAYVGVRHAVSLPHATAGLHLACAALGLGPGDEVIAPDVTWIASVAPIVYTGAVPVLVAIDPVTWCLDPDAVAAAVTPRTRAILGVDLYGSLCDWPRLGEIADRHGLALIEDAAEALGSEIRGRRAGVFGDLAAFSFHGSKTVSTGEGGMLVTDDDALHARVQTLRDHGRAPGDRFFQNHEIAFKYKMSPVTAAIGIAQMERIDDLVAYKRRLFGWYADRLGGRNDLTLNAEPEGVSNSYWMVTVIPDTSHGLDKFTLQARLRTHGVDSRPFFSALSSLPAFADRPESTRHADPDHPGHRLAERGVNLPSGYGLTEADVDRVCRALDAALMG